jgi:DNA-binding response OmpR family regulator
MTSVWVIEDDPSIRQGLVRALGADGHDVASASSVAEAGLLTGRPALVLLDVNLPDGDGFDVCRALLARFPDTRVIMLTARAEEIDVIDGLDAGAVDYVTKPFRLAELRARIRVQLRVGQPGEHSDSVDIVSAGDIRLDRGSRRAWREGNELTLRVKEFDLLERLLRDAGRVVRREELMHDVWDEHWFGSTKTLDVHIAALRRRFGETDDEPSRISTIRGVGFRFESHR